jgi:type II secretory pathway component PulJ
MRRHSERFSRGSRGYTILEICLVLFIGSLIAAISLPLISTVLEEQRLQTVSRKLEQMARIARHHALTSHHTYRILFRAGSFALEPVPAQSDQDRERPAAEVYKLPSGITFQLKRWQETGWHKPADESWVFEPNGLVEPVQVKVVQDKAWIELAFDPLCAAVQSERSYMP